MSSSRSEVVVARVLVVAVFVLGAVVWDVRVRLDDEMLGAWWIGHMKCAARARPCEVGFARRVDFPFEVPSATLKLRADLAYEAYFDRRLVGSGGGVGAPLEVWELPGTFAAGAHEISVVVSHPEGVASLRLGLDAVRLGRNCVVTDSTWRVDDDADRIRVRGIDGARYPAALWGRPPLSSWGISSSNRSWRGIAALSKTVVSSRTP